jgi:hypothetical protein
MFDRTDGCVLRQHSPARLAIVSLSATLSILPVPSLGSGTSEIQTKAGSLNWAICLARKPSSSSFSMPPPLAVDHCGRDFAEPLVGHSEHGGLADPGMGIDGRFDLLDADILAAADDDVLLAVDDEEVVVLVEIARRLPSSNRGPR